MKTILFFCNPFGLGPAGKTINVAQYINAKTNNLNIIVCGCKHVLSIAGNDFHTIELNDRDVNDITSYINTIPGDKYVFSSQNRFAIYAAKQCGIRSAFLDGLSWFWQTVPDDHYIADIIFWLNYPNISIKIPHNYRNKISIIPGIVDNFKLVPNSKRSGSMFYIGGCKNPLTSLPHFYLDMIAQIYNSTNLAKIKLMIAADEESVKYLSQYPKLLSITKNFNHNTFIHALAKVSSLITNGGQTASIEAFNASTSISYFLPINQSQNALVKSILSIDKYYPCLQWEKYFQMPKNMNYLTEKEALEIYEDKSRTILNNQNLFNIVKNDFSHLIADRGFHAPTLFNQIGTNGSEEIFKILHEQWGIS